MSGYKTLLVASACVALSAAQSAAQLAPTGSHYGGRTTDTGSTSVSNMGGYSTAVPLDLVPARGGLPVPISVASGGRGVGAVGLGWDIAISSIRRDTSIARRRPAYQPGGQLAAREALVLTLNGQTLEMIARDATSWVARIDAPDLELRKEGPTRWRLLDGHGRQYVFDTPTCSLTTPCTPIPDLWLLTSIISPDNRVELLYDVRFENIATNELVSFVGTGYSVDLTQVRYNTHKTASSCFKDIVRLSYDREARPLKVQNLGAHNVFRMSRLTDVVVSRTTSCNTESAVRRYGFHYAQDPDTKLQRLASVDVRGQDGTAEAATPAPVAAYTYGSATNGSLSDPKLVFVKGPEVPLPADIGSAQVLASTNHDGGASTPDGGKAYVSWHTLIDITGDGRTDLVFKKNDQLWVAVNRPDGSFMTTLVGGPTIQIGSKPLAKHSNEQLRYGYSWQTRVQEWRQVVDMNGDGRLDIVDAEQHDGEWTVYLNTPGNPVTWVEKRINTFHLKTMLENAGHEIDGDKVPLSRKTTGYDTEMTECLVWSSTLDRYVPHPFPETCAFDPATYVAQRRAGPEKTFLEWSLRDLNGDGYPDLAYAGSPVIRTEPMEPHVLEGYLIAFIRRSLIIEHPSTKALYNVAGVRLNFENIFSTPVAVVGTCAPEYWEYSHQRCRFADIDGDGVQDRLESGVAQLGAGNPFATNRPKIGIGGDWNETRNRYLSDCVEAQLPESTDTVESALRDVNGDGIVDRMQGGRIAFGTGTGYAEAIDALGDPNWISHTIDDCGGEFARTTGGLYDMDGDGKPEYVTISHNPARLNIFYLVGGPGGRNAAGRITAIDNGHRARTLITYRSTKEVASNLPFPEIVVASTETVATMGLGGSLTSVNYAYGGAKMYFDPISDSFTTRGYETVVEVYGTGAEQQQASHAIVRLSNPLEPYTPGMSEAARFQRYQTAGRSSYSFFVGYNVPRDPWILLGSFDPWTDTRRLGSTRQYWSSRHLPVSTPIGNTVDCEDVPDPYYWTEPGTGLPLCRSRGFTYVRASESWAGTQPPPGSFSNVESRYEVTSIDDHANVVSFRNENDRHVTDDDVCTETTYAAPIMGTRVFAAVARRTLTDCGPADHRQVLRVDSWEYDGLPLGSVGAGRVTSHSVERFDTSSGTSLGQIREYEATHDAVGNLEYVVTSRGTAVRSIEIVYDDYGLVPIGSQLDASGVSPVRVHTTRDPLTLAIVAQTDANGTIWGQELDGLGRPTRTTVKPVDGALGVTSTTTYVGFEGGTPRSVRTKAFVDPLLPGADEKTAPAREAITYLDELGRTTKTVSLLGASYANESLVTSRTYDGLGRVSFEADPFPASQNAATAFGTTYHYGTDGALLCTIRGNGRQPLSWTTDVDDERFPACQTRVFSNHRLQVTTSAPDGLASGPQAGVTRTDTFTAAGHLLSRETHQNGVRLELETFTYDRLGQTTGMTRYRDPASTAPSEHVEWRFRNDSLGQLLSLAEPQNAERVNTYSAWGELTTTTWTDTSTTPAKKMALERSYDAFGRITETRESIDAQVLPETTFQWFYDTDQGAPFASTNLVGRLTRTHSAIGDTFLSYDAFGRAQKRAFVDAGDEAYLEDYQHRFDGSLARLELRLPDTGYMPERFNYTYDSAGALRSVIDGAGTDLYNAKSIDAFGRVRSAKYGTVTVAASHADTGRRLPIQLQIILASGDRRVIDYGTFDAAGREASRTETVGPTASSTVISSYDALGRLETSFAGGGALAFNTTFTYDALGNITSLADSTASQNVSLQYATGANADRDRLCRVDYGAPTVGPCNVRHDDSGNVVEMPTRTGTRVLEYFPSGAIKQIKTADALATFRSDGSGAISELDVVGPKDPRRTRRYGLVERRRLDTGADILVRNIPGAGGIVASRRGPTGPDITPFGEARGLRFSTDGTSFVQDVNYLPFGQSLSSGDVNSRTYTSAQWNAGDNLSDLGVSQLGARIYDPALGRFLSRDPLLVPRTATTTNPYAFAANDPINFSDPSGLDLSICVTSGGNACAAGSDSSTDAEIGAAAAAGVFAIGVRVFGGGGDSSGVNPSYLPRPTSTADSFTQIYAFSALPPEGEDFNATLQKRIPSTPVRSYSYSGPPGIAQVVAFFGWVFGDATDDFDNVPPFRILFRTAFEVADGFAAFSLAGRAVTAGRAVAGTRALGSRAATRGAGRAATRAVEEEASTIFYHGTNASSAPGMIGNLQPVSTVTYGQRLGSFFTHAATEPDALIMASHWALRNSSNSLSVRVLQIRIPNSLLKELSESSPRLMVTRSVPGLYSATMETIFLPEALPYLNTSAEFSIIAPAF